VAYLAQNRLDTAVHQVPRAIDQEVARLKLAALGLTIDTLTDEQDRYLASWREGT
jgi:adenosylhomocysteinase